MQPALRTRLQLYRKQRLPAIHRAGGFLHRHVYQRAGKGGMRAASFRRHVL